MSALRDALTGGAPTVDDLRAATVADIDRLECPLVQPAVMAPHCWDYARTHAREVQLYLDDTDGPIPAARLEAARQRFPGHGIWGRVFAIYGHRTAITPALREMLATSGAQARLFPVPFTLLVVGLELALIALAQDGGPPPGAYVVTDAVMVADLRTMFVGLWASSEPVGGDPGGDVLELVRLLTSGLTDSVAAQRMQVSLRTYRRRIAELMATLDVSSRFAAGVEADRRGLVALAEALDGGAVRVVRPRSTGNGDLRVV